MTEVLARSESRTARPDVCADTRTTRAGGRTEALCRDVALFARPRIWIRIALARSLANGELLIEAELPASMSDELLYESARVRRTWCRLSTAWTGPLVDRAG
jgi:hypothetical protein